MDSRHPQGGSRRRAPTTTRHKPARPIPPVDDHEKSRSADRRTRESLILDRVGRFSARLLPDDRVVGPFGRLGARSRDPHQGGPTCGFRVSEETSSLAYLSDHHSLALGPGPVGVGEMHPNALALARDVDLLTPTRSTSSRSYPTSLPSPTPGASMRSRPPRAARSACSTMLRAHRRRPHELAGRFAKSAVPARIAFDGLALILGDPDRTGVRSVGH